jgi:hypothetical protein
MFTVASDRNALSTTLSASQQSAATLSVSPGLVEPLQQANRWVRASAPATAPRSPITPIIPVVPLPIISLTDNTIATAQNLGALSGLLGRSGFVGSSDTVDFYRFNTTGGAFNLSLAGMSADADVSLIRDGNGNGIVEVGEIIANSRRSGAQDEAINLAAIAAGDYLIRVEQYSGNTAYSLHVSNASPSNLLPTETNIGALSGTQVFSGSIDNSNTADTYRFSVSNRAVNLTLSGLSGDADVRLIRDVNNNGAIDSGDILTTSTRSGNAAEWLNSSLTTGTYFVQVYQFSGSTNYHLSVSTGDWFSANLTDAGVIGEARFAAADNWINRNEMMAVLRETRDYGSIDATEVTDLRRLLSGRGNLMPEYVRNLTHKVINGDAANPRSGIGNLFAGSTATQLDRLIGKWFLGTDRPAASGTYRYVSGALTQAGFSVHDIVQGGTGDCYFLSSLGALALDRPSVLSNMFIDNADGTFTVRFFNNGNAEYVTVDRYLPTDASGNAVYAGWGGGGNTRSTNELWVALAERAYAQLNQSGWIEQDNTNSYEGIDSGWMAPVLRQITGGSASSQSVNAMTRTQLINLVNGNTPITAGFVNGGGYGVVDMHAYTISSYNAATQRFHLDNPWGYSDASVTWEELRALRAEIEWSNV